MDATKACASCGATVAAEEVAQGLAVLVSGRLLCPQCVEHLPGDARVMVNQMRALRGMAATTYLYASPRHPGLVLFTFTTSALVLSHRRRLAHGEEITTPVLPPPGSRPRLPTAAEAAKGERHGWIVVLAVAALVIIGLIWLFRGSAAMPAVTPPPPAALATTPIVALPEPPAQTPRYALQITALENRLHSAPRDAAEIQRQAELLHDSIPASEVFLRNRVVDLMREATAAIPPPPVQPPPQPEPAAPPVPVPAPMPEPPPAQPEPEPTRPVAADPVVLAPPPAQTDAPPAPKPNAADQVEGPKPARPAQPAGPVRLEAWDPVISWPDRWKPVVSPETGVPAADAAIPWPWPSGVAVWGAYFDRRSKPRRLAIEFSVPAIDGPGGLALAVDPRRADRTALLATWTDGTTTPPGVTITLDEAGWQSIAIPLPDLELDRSRLRLRIEDAKDLQESRAFLVGGATLVHGRTPLPEDCDPGLPLIAPSMVAELGSVASREVAFRKTFGLLLRSLPERRDLTAVKILLPEVQNANQQPFRSELRKRLEAFQHQVRRNDPGKLLDGNPADLPLHNLATVLDIKAGWPGKNLDDLDQYAVAVVGLRRADWLPDKELAGFAQHLVDKLRTAQARPRRPAVLPVYAIGDIEKADAKVCSALDARWLPVAQGLVARGYPVIDLRLAMREKLADDARRVAARLLVDALRQIDWLARQPR